MQEILFKEVTKQWLNIKKLSVKYSTYVKYDSVIDIHLLNEYQDMLISQITEEMVLNYFYDLINEKKFATSTVQTIRFILKSIYEYSSEKYETSKINFNHIKVGAKEKKLRLLSIEEKQLLDSYCFKHDEPIAFMIIISLYGGLRVGEAAGVRWQDIDVSTGTININKTIQRLKVLNEDKKTRIMILEPKTKSSKRIVPLPQFVLDYIDNYKKKYPIKNMSDYIYTNSNKISDPRNIQYNYNRICKKLSFKSTYHTLRHTYATYCVMSDVEIKSLSEILGHSKVSTTLELYVHSTLEFKKKQISKIKEPELITE